jgi:Zn-dependent M28 family amino/carboxypeptidase
MHGFLQQPTMALADKSLGGDMFDFDIETAAFVKKELVKDIFKLNGLRLKKELKNIAKGEFASKNLESKLNISYTINVENINCKNVVAVLPGSDPELKSEYVVLGGHLDHVGVGEEIKGDSIYNGMWDNATGSAAIMSISKVYNELTEKPKRSIVFVCYTGEEKGLLGSNFYAQRNGITDGKIVANINIDMLGGLFESKDIIPLGYSHSNLSEAIDFSAKSLNFTIDDNKKMENMYIQRSDQISYIKIGAPVINVANGLNAVDPKINGEKFDEKWMKKFYHSPFDDINQEFSSESFLKAIKLNFLTLYYTTNVIEDIKWNEESWLYKKYVMEK